MKQTLSRLFLLLLCLGILSGCTAQNEPTNGTGQAQSETIAQEQAPTALNIAALKGPTAMGMVELMRQADSGEIADNQLQFFIAASADEITPKLVQGDLDIAAVPANLAAVLYQRTSGEIQVLAINTLGVLYLVENGESIQSVADMRGKTIYASGKGATPEYALNYILTANGMDPSTDVTIAWKSEHSECVSALAADKNGIALLPQPFVTTAQSTHEGMRIALDLTEEWDALQAQSDSPSALITGVVVVRSEFAQENPQAVLAFLEEYRQSVDYVNSNVTQAAALIEQYDIVPAAIAEKALPYCNICFIEGDEMREKLSGYLAVLFEAEPQSIGGAMPGDDFYYER